MEADPHTQGVVEVPPAATHGAAPNVMDVSAPMMILTWVTFLLLALVLYKVAWKPILKVLDMREKSIRDALEQAEKARTEAAATEVRNREMLQAAERESQKLVAEARVAAQETARLVQDRAEQKSKALLEEARRDIEAATGQARAALRLETTELVIELAGKILAENMNTERNRALVGDMTKELDRK
jgi:F-type H+-transporting ATPase subunit b